MRGQLTATVGLERCQGQGLGWGGGRDLNSPQSHREVGPAALGMGAGEFVGTETHCKSKAHADFEDLAEKKEQKYFITILRWLHVDIVIFWR